MGNMQRQAATNHLQDERDPAATLEQSFPEFLIDSLPCTFFVINQDGRFIRWNRNFQILSEYSDQEIGSMPVLDVVVEEHREAVDRRRATGVRRPDDPDGCGLPDQERPDRAAVRNRPTRHDRGA